MQVVKKQEWSEDLHKIEDNAASFRPTSFASLLNRKLVILSANSPDYVALDRYFFHEVLRPTINRIRVDRDWYITAYPDVAEAVSKKLVTDACDHFRRFGYFEHRMPYEILVQEDWYLEQYPDVREAIEQRAFTTGQNHFDVCGYREGRMPFPNFELSMT